MSYKEPLDNVYDGKWKYSCFIRLDFERRLLDLSQCSILDSAEDFSLYDKDNFFIGRYFFESDYEQTYIHGGYQYTSMRLSLSSAGLFNTVSSDEIRTARLKNPKWKTHKDDIQCNKKGSEVFQTNDPNFPYICKKPYECKKGKYAIDEIFCGVLPKNARRLPEKGFECLNGYELYEDSDTTYCFKPFACPKGYYAVDRSTCAKLPRNAQRLPENGLECLNGYELYEDSDTTYCFKPFVCPKDYYAVDRSTCKRLPKNAKRLPENGLECLNGYELYEDSDTTYCFKPFACPKGYYAVDKTTCAKLPRNAIRLPEDGLDCIKGYYLYHDADTAYCYQNFFTE